MLLCLFQKVTAVHIIILDMSRGDDEDHSDVTRSLLLYTTPRGDDGESSRRPGF